MKLKTGAILAAGVLLAGTAVAILPMAASNAAVVPHSSGIARADREFTEITAGF
jgi:hypothetical protein